MADEQRGKGDDQDGQNQHRKQRRSLLAGFTLGQTSTSRDPLERYQEILSDENLTDEHKRILLEFARTRFRNRQIMAYIALGGILATVAVMLGGALWGADDNGNVMSSLAEVANLIGGANALLTGIVASYFGVTSFRPSN